MPIVQLSFLDGKVCTKCHQWKPLSEFYKNRDKLRPDCRTCVTKRVAEYVLAHPKEAAERKRRWAKRNEPRLRQQRRAYYEANKDRFAASFRQRYENKGEDIRAANRRRYHANRDRYRQVLRAYTVKHRQEKRVYDANYRAANRERIQSSQGEYRAANRERIRQVIRAHHLANKEAYIHAAAQRRAREANAPGTHSLEEWSALKAQYNYSCLRCHRKEPDISLTRDHVMPLIRGGSHDISNIQPLCKSCNCSKGTKSTDYRTQPSPPGHPS